MEAAIELESMSWGFLSGTYYEKDILYDKKETSESIMTCTALLPLLQLYGFSGCWSQI